MGIIVPTIVALLLVVSSAGAASPPAPSKFQCDGKLSRMKEKAVAIRGVHVEIGFSDVRIEGARRSSAAATSERHMIDSPPSTISEAPVMNEASSLASQRIGAAISPGAAHRPRSEVVLRSVFSASTLLPAASARAM
jgi:hypothetical protein